MSMKLHILEVLVNEVPPCGARAWGKLLTDSCAC